MGPICHSCHSIFHFGGFFFCLAYGVPQMSQKRRNFFSEPPSRHFNKPQLNRKPRSLINPQLPNPPHKNNGIYFYCSSYSRPPPPPPAVCERREASQTTTTKIGAETAPNGGAWGLAQVHCEQPRRTWHGCVRAVHQRDTTGRWRDALSLK